MRDICTQHNTPDGHIVEANSGDLAGGGTRAVDVLAGYTGGVALGQDAAPLRGPCRVQDWFLELVQVEHPSNALGQARARPLYPKDIHQLEVKPLR